MFTFVFLLLLFPLLGRGVSCCSIFTVTYYFVLIKKLKQLYGVHVLTMLFVLIAHTCVQHDFNITWCLCRLEAALRVSPVEQELFTSLEHPRSPPYFFLFWRGWAVHVAQSLLSLVFCRSLFVLLYFFFWPLYCLSFCDLRLLIIPLVSSSIF